MYPRRLLPGIAVDIPPPAFPDALPRMDVALFVGFAERGPTHRPVAIDSVEAYAAVFGGDVVLAHGAHPLNAALAPTVRGFFSNGGTRAWVIRVARTEALERRWRGAGATADVAIARTFSLPEVPGARVRASSVGSWADDVRVSARVERSRGRLRLMLRAERGSVEVVAGPFGVSPDDPDSWWNERDDDDVYADPAAVAGPRSWLAPTGSPATWNLDALTDFWSDPVGADKETRTPLERDGLSRFDAELFLDPALATASIAGLGDTAARMRDIDGVPLLGLHGAFAVPGGADFAEPSMIAVPDAALPGWSPRVDETLILPVNVQGDIPARWRDHIGSCAVPEPEPGMGRPDPARFLDCSTRLLRAPVFAALDDDKQPAGMVALIWSASEPGATYVLEESARADFAGAEEIWRGETLGHSVEVTREGAYYYRVRAELDGNISMASVIGFLVQDSAWQEVAEADYDPEPLLKVRIALLRACAAIGDQFALLSLPRHYRASDAAQHVATLAGRLPQNEVRALSHGALYHPWIASPLGSAADPDWLVVPPEGVVAGTFARRARQRGAWLAPANIPVDDVVALSPIVHDRDREDFARARVKF